MALPILRHQNNGRLQHGEHVDPSAKEQIWVRIETVIGKKEAVYQHPCVKKKHRGDNEFPTAAKRRDEIRRAIRQSQLRCFLYVNVARGTMTQELIGVPESVRKCRQQSERDVRTAPHKRQKMLSRENRESGVLGNNGISGPPLSVEQRHLTKKITVAKLCQRYLMALRRPHTNPDLSALDHIHRVALLAGAEQKCAGFAVEGLQQMT